MLKSTKEGLEKGRKELLDFTLRNPLLNHRKRAKQIPVINEKSESLFDLLITNNKTMSFEPLPDSIDAEGKSAAELATLLSKKDEQTDENGFSAVHKDNKLQSSLTADKLQKMLLSINYDAKTYIEEQGVNILYLVLGFLYWYETPGAAEPRRAPLILIPVSISRLSAKDRFSLQYTGEDLGDNLSLAAKMKAEYGITLPSVGDVDEFDTKTYYKNIADAISKEPKWHIETDEITLAFFSFGKFLMYNDLDPEKWADTESSILDSVLSTGFKNEKNGLPDETKIDNIVFPDNSFQIRDADSSQVLALLDANDGRSMVIQGPPGTGKSQTITNIIAESIGRGKTVLFISEKMAALDVVKKRLDEAGIGDAVLELHSYKTNKKQVLGELGRVMSLGKPVFNNDAYEARDYLDSRDALNKYCDAVNSVVEGTSLSFVDAVGKKNLLETPEIKTLQYPEININEDAYRRIRNFIIEIGRLIKDKGRPDLNPFFGTSADSVTPDFKKKVSEQALAYAVKVAEVIGQAELFRKYSDNPRAFNEFGILMETANYAESAPEGTSKTDFRSVAWLESAAQISAYVEAVTKMNEITAKYSAKVIDDIWSQDLLAERRTIASNSNSMFRLLSSDFRKAVNSVKGFLKSGVSMNTDEMLSLLDAVSEVKQIKSELDSASAKMLPIFNDVMADRKSLKSIADYLISVHADIKSGRLNPCIFDLIASENEHVFFQENTSELKRLKALADEVGAKLYSLIGTETKSFDSLDALHSFITSMSEETDMLDSAAYYRHAVSKLKDEGLEDVMRIAASWEGNGDDFVRAYDYFWYKGIADRAFSSNPVITHFDSSAHAAKIDTFNRTDKLILEKNRSKVALKHWERIPKGTEGEMSIIRREINKKKMHMPIRKLLSEAGHAVQAIKPVFMMSPLSISTYIPEGTLKFDMVVFDEASQVKPVDAFGALLRGSQAVVVGDSKQLPPTSFFDKVGTDEEEEENYDSLGDMESILSLFCAQGAWERMLRWHYRSRHESLITVSNEKFYDNRLVVFPSPGFNIADMGLKFVYCPDTVYDRGKTRTNIKEAEIVAKSVMAHAKETPSISLGVVAFSTSQRDAIEDQLEKLRRADDSCEEFFSSGRHEAFFIKNLENVQGDERDVIYISIGYGRTEDGQFAMSFGPLTAQGGERRLNVLISRSKRAMKVFANFRAADLDLTRTNSVGVAALKAFIEYAETGKVLESASQRITVSSFEEAVAQHLRKKGLTVDTGIGTSSFRLDAGIADEDKKGMYALGISCDGHFYGNALSARDRDRTRIDVLRGLGWNLHRIWSTEWYRSPEKEVEKVLKALNSKGPEVVKTEKKQEKQEIVREEAVVEVMDETAEYKATNVKISLKGKDFCDLNYIDFKQYILEILKNESPIHIDLLTKRLRIGAGLAKAGTKIQNHVLSIAKTSSGMGLCRMKGNFIWDLSTTEPIVRNRAGLDAADRKIEYVTDEEITIALRDTVKGSFGLTSDDVVSLVLKKLGFTKSSSNAVDTVNAVLSQVIKNGGIKEEGGRLVLIENK